MKAYSQSAWNLNDLYPGIESQEIEIAFDMLTSLARHIETFKPYIADNISPAILMDIINELDSFHYECRKLRAFANLSITENVKNQSASDLLSRTDQRISQLSNQVLFFELWWKELDDAHAERLMSHSEKYKPWLRSLRRDKKYTLSESEEKLIQIKNATGRQAINKLYNTITSQYSFKLTLDGEEKTLSRGEIMRYMRHPDPDLRAASIQEHYRVLIDDRFVLGQIYQTIAQDWRNEYIDMRGYERPVSVRNLDNDIPDEIVDTLLDVAKQNVSVFQRFFKLKSKLLGMEKMRRYDLYAPVTQTDKMLPFEDASALILETFQAFDPIFGDLANRMFAEKHIDSEARDAKDFLPFCSNAAHKITPYINVFYQGKTNDASTLHHEVGHAIHAMLASKNSTFTANPCLPLAETASIFSEMLFIDKLLEKEGNPIVRRDILIGQIEHAYSGIQRQAFTAIFENKAHDMIHKGASIDEIAETYMDGLRFQFGDSMEVSDEFRWEWVGYPHLYNWPFYVYAYTFGHLVVLSLYQQYKKEGAAFVPKYIEFLSAGSSKPPVELLKDLGVDPYQGSFWQRGYDFISEMIDKIEAY